MFRKRFSTHLSQQQARHARQTLVNTREKLWNHLFYFYNNIYRVMLIGRTNVIYGHVMYNINKETVNVNDALSIDCLI